MCPDSCQDQRRSNEHKAPDSSIFVLNNGAIGFKCLHNSCQDKKWKDVRLIYEPDAYQLPDKLEKEITDGWNRYNRNKTRQEVPGVNFNINVPAVDGEPFFMDMKEILEKPEPVKEYIPTGIHDIDIEMQGLAKGEISVLSGLRGAAKSTIISQIMLNAVNHGQRVICYSGELTPKNFQQWMFLQAAGKRYVVRRGRYKNSYDVADDDKGSIKKAIVQWMTADGGHFWLFNNNYGNAFNNLAQLLQIQANKVKADFIVIDNLMALDLDATLVDKYEAQTKFAKNLKNIAKICNVHILFVAHPRKVSGFLRLNDISGSGNITNIVDSAFIIHRNNTDFSKAINEYLGKKKSQYIPDSCTNVIEICKDRENGTQDFFIPLWFERETKRLKNNPSEVVHYGWEEIFNNKINIHSKNLF